jgi:universal stress protein A
MALRKVCCPVDFSAESHVAMRHAAELAWRFGGDLTLVHVDDRPRRPADETLASPKDLDIGELELERTLASWRDQVEKITRKAVDYVLLAGAPAEEIARFARAGGYDVVVMGTHGRTGREAWTLGSVAQAVVRDAPCTVAVVREPPHVAQPPAPR